MRGWSRATPEMFGRLNPTRAMGLAPAPPPPHDTAEAPTARAAAIVTPPRIRMRIGSSSLIPVRPDRFREREPRGPGRPRLGQLDDRDDDAAELRDRVERQVR